MKCARWAQQRAFPIIADVSSWEDAQRAVQTTISEMGGFHVLVNDAGINPRSEGFFEINPADWTRAISVNFTGPFMMARAAVPHLREQGWGRIIGVTTSYTTMLRGAPYGPSKAGHEALISVMAHDLRDTASPSMPCCRAARWTPI